MTSPTDVAAADERKAAAEKAMNAAYQAHQKTAAVLSAAQAEFAAAAEARAAFEIKEPSTC
jgi:hypothetical protein